MRVLCTIRPVIVAAMEDTEAPGFRFIPRKGPVAATAGERRPGAFVRLVTGLASGVGNAIGAMRHRWNDESPNHQRAEVRGVGLTRMHGVARTSPKAHQPRDEQTTERPIGPMRSGPDPQPGGLGLSSPSPSLPLNRKQETSVGANP